MNKKTTSWILLQICSKNQITESPDRKKKDQKKHIDASVFSHLIILSAMAGQESGRRLQTALKPAEGRGFLTPAREAEGSTATNSKSPPENGGFPLEAEGSTVTNSKSPLKMGGVLEVWRFRLWKPSFL